MYTTILAYVIAFLGLVIIGSGFWGLFYLQSGARHPFQLQNQSQRDRPTPRRTKREGSGELSFTERLKRSPHSERDPQQSRRPIRLTDGFALSPMCRGDHHGNVGCRTNTGAILLSDCRQAYALAGL
jgi:hypothetical protein